MEAWGNAVRLAPCFMHAVIKVTRFNSPLVGFHFTGWNNNVCLSNKHYHVVLESYGLVMLCDVVKAGRLISRCLEKTLTLVYRHTWVTDDVKTTGFWRHTTIGSLSPRNDQMCLTNTYIPSAAKYNINSHIS